MLVLLDLSILLGKKVQKVEASISKIKYRATRFIFLVFGCGSQSNRKWTGRQEFKVPYKDEGTV